MEFLTREEFDRVESRLNELKGRRKILSERIAEARALGDLKENADYHAAREEQGLDEAEIKRLEDRLSQAKIIDKDAAPDDVVFIGATVRIREVDTDDDECVKLVGEPTGDPLADPVEVTAGSPMGEALMKARVGETVRVDTPRGVKRFEVLEIL
ncbi:MAG: transcription elongation factor GreA [Planctomycetota bacterium]|nr:transcription elongation factor GreA [Planctomycetota bacterium]